MKYIKKALTIEAEQFDGNPKQKGVCTNLECGTHGRAHVHTMHAGQIVALKLGDWVIPEPNGVNFYPCDDEVFRKTYQPIE